MNVSIGRVLTVTEYRMWRTDHIKKSYDQVRISQKSMDDMLVVDNNVFPEFPKVVKKMGDCFGVA